MAKKNLYAKVQAEDEESRRKIEEGIEGQREHFDNHGLHIGYVYGDTCIPAHASAYIRRFVVGSRLPHVWLKQKPGTEWFRRLELGPIDSSYVSEFTETQAREREWSVLDLCAFDAFTLFVGQRDGQRWRMLCEEIRSMLPPTLKINLAVLGEDFELLNGGDAEMWVTEMGLDDGGAVLVRPDQHILAIFPAQTTADTAERALEGHLGL
jgi:hypothetical protein